jgi:hypothetical protein
MGRSGVSQLEPANVEGGRGPDPALQQGGGRTHNPLVAVLLAWLVFGLGHMYLGRRWKAAVLFVLLTAAFVTGLVLSRAVFFPVDTEAFAWWLGGLGTLAYLWAGLFYAAALVLIGAGGAMQLPTYEIGWVAALSAGLLNLLAMLDAWDIAVRKKD